MTTASKITILRVLLIPIYMVIMLLGHPHAACVVFILASITDGVDGYIARHYNQVSDFGKFLDPLADKLLVISAMLIFCEWGRMDSWAVMVVLAREFAVSGLRMVAAANGSVIAAAMLGKAKTATTMTALCVMMVFSTGYVSWITCTDILDLVCEIVIVVFTVVSGVEYFIKNWSVLGISKKK